jgi:hypothetical protein
MLKTVRKPDDVLAFEKIDLVSSLKMYLDELKYIPAGIESAHKYHILTSRILFQIFIDEIKPPVIENEINEGRGRIDIVYRVLDREGAFKKLRDIWKIHCPQVIVECKNYKNSLSNTEYDQLFGRLSKDRGMLGILLCRKKVDPAKVLKHCMDRLRSSRDRYIIVLDDDDLRYLGNLRLSQESYSDSISDFMENKIAEIID